MSNNTSAGAADNTSDDSTSPAPGSRERVNFIWYLCGVGSWFSMFGMQVVLFPWLVLIALQESAARAGTAQMALLLPGLLFILLGGAVADRKDRRAITRLCHLLGGIPALLLAAAVMLDLLSFPLMLAYGFAVGTAQAFLFPARDGMLPYIARGNIQRAVTSATMVQFAVQLGGFALAGMAASIGAAPLLVVQALLLWFGALAFHRLDLSHLPAPVRSGPAPRNIAMIADTALIVWRHRTLRDVIILIGGMGFFLMGVIFVGVPLVIRDIYGGDSGDLALINMFNMGGMSLTAFVLLRKGGVARQGRAITCALGIGGLMLAAIGLGLPYPAPLLLMAGWGICGSITMSMGRTIVQEASPEAHRSRAMAFYMLGFMGTAPFGSFMIGQLAEYIGPLHAIAFSALGMTVIALWIALRSPIWRLEGSGNS